MICNYVTLPDGQQIHYRQTGKGPALVILHPSPQSSEAMMSAISAFSSICTCFAIDTAGYGFSDDFECDQPTITDYADNLIATIDAIGIGSFCLYGAATGSQIAIEVGKKYPDRINFLMLDTNGHLSDNERAEMLDGYFPDVTARRDGSHLLTYWDMCRDLFASFPWNSGKVADQRRMDVPPAKLIQDVMNRYLQAGENYAKAYSVAFHVENRGHLNGLDVPTTMMRWEGSPIVSMADDLIAQGLPECVELLRAGLPIQERYDLQSERLKSVVATLPKQDIRPKQSNVPSDFAWQRTYFNTEFGQIHAYQNQTRSGLPLVMLHGAGSSARQILEQANVDAIDRPVLALDLPGHGASHKLPNDDLSLSLFAGPIIAVLKQLDFEAADILGQGLGEAVGTLIGRHIQARHLQAVAPDLYQDEDKGRIISHGFPDLTPQIDGTHLVRAWSWIRDNSRYQPWFDHSAAALKQQDADLSPENLHRQAVDILRTGASWQNLKLFELQCL